MSWLLDCLVGRRRRGAEPWEAEPSAKQASRLDAAAAGFQACAITEDFAEGVGAFLDKQVPCFAGRQAHRNGSRAIDPASANLLSRH